MLINLDLLHILPLAYSRPLIHTVILLHTFLHHNLCGLHKTFPKVFCLLNLHTHHCLSVFYSFQQRHNNINAMIHLSYIFFL
jgi:hypothetical protein